MSAGSALTGLSVGGLALVGGTVGLASYSSWAAANPNEASTFQQNVAENFLAQNVDAENPTASGCGVYIDDLPDSVKGSIIQYVGSAFRTAQTLPVVPSSFPSTFYAGTLPSTWNGKNVTINANGNAWLNSFPGWVAGIGELSNRWVCTGGYGITGDVTISFVGTSGYNDVVHFEIGDGGCVTFAEWPSGSVNNVAEHYESFNANFTTAGYRPVFVNGVNMGAGYQSGYMDSFQSVPAGLSTAMQSYIAGNATLNDVIGTTANVEGVYVPNVTVDTATGVPTVGDTDWLTVTYPDVAFGVGISPDAPGFDFSDILTALNAIAGMVSPLGALSVLPTTVANIDTNLTSIPPLVADIADGIGAIVDTWPTIDEVIRGLDGVHDVLDGILDGIAIDIPLKLDDLEGILLPVPGLLQGLQTLTGGISTGIGTLGTTASQILTGVQAIPGSIAQALDLDWVLDGVEQLKLRLPEPSTTIVLPQATFDDLRNVCNDYKSKTPIGKIFEAYEGAFDVMSSQPDAAPRYEITFPEPINYTFVIDFSVFNGLFVTLAHAFFYMLAIFWYMKFIKSMVGWMKGLFGSTYLRNVAEEESYGWRE